MKALGKAFDLKGLAAAFGEAFDPKSCIAAFREALDLGDAARSFAAGFRDGAHLVGRHFRQALAAVGLDGRRRELPEWQSLSQLQSFQLHFHLQRQGVHRHGAKHAFAPHRSVLERWVLERVSFRRKNSLGSVLLRVAERESGWRLDEDMLVQEGMPRPPIQGPATQRRPGYVELLQGCLGLYSHRG